MKLALYSYWRSSCSWRVRIGLALKGLPYETRAVHLVRAGGEQWREDYREKSPLGQVPCLEVTDDGGGVTRLVQSLPILEWLEETHPAPALLPHDPLTRARVRAVAEIVNSGTQPLQNRQVMNAVKDLGADEQAWCARWIANGLDALERTLGPGADRPAAETAGPFAFGARPTLADVCLVPQIYNAIRFGVDLAAYPTLRRINDACASEPAFEAAVPHRQPDAE